MRCSISSLMTLLVLGSASTAAKAQGWIKMPNGSLAYVADYTTTGIFSCGNPRFILGKCLAMGNSVTVWKGNSSATITYTGVNQTLVAPSTRSRTIELGNLQTTFSGAGPKLFPSLSSSIYRLFYLGVGITTTSPMVSTGYVNFGFATRPRGLVSYTGGVSTTRFAVAPPPPPATYSGMPLGGLSYPLLETNEEIHDITARVSVAPEPATLALIGSGLLGVLGLARRRAMRRDREVTPPMQ